jgi:hypothetical protein
VPPKHCALGDGNVLAWKIYNSKPTAPNGTPDETATMDAAGKISIDGTQYINGEIQIKEELRHYVAKPKHTLRFTYFYEDVITRFNFKIF